MDYAPEDYVPGVKVPEKRESHPTDYEPGKAVTVRTEIPKTNIFEKIKDFIPHGKSREAFSELAKKSAPDHVSEPAPISPTESETTNFDLAKEQDELFVRWYNAGTLADSAALHRNGGSQGELGQLVAKLHNRTLTHAEVERFRTLAFADQPQQETEVLETKVCSNCGEKFETRNGSDLCSSCHLSRITDGFKFAPDDIDSKEALIAAGEITDAIVPISGLKEKDIYQYIIYSDRVAKLQIDHDSGDDVLVKRGWKRSRHARATVTAVTDNGCKVQLGDFDGLDSRAIDTKIAAMQAYFNPLVNHNLYFHWDSSGIVYYNANDKRVYEGSPFKLYFKPNRELLPDAYGKPISYKALMEWYKQQQKKK